jgi:hypothetical protein
MNQRFKLLCSCVLSGTLAALCLYPVTSEILARRRASQRLELVEAGLRAGAKEHVALDPLLSLRVRWLGPLLASWQTVGGCGAGSSGGAGAAVKWIGRSTTGGLFQTQIIGSYLHFGEVHREPGEGGPNYSSAYNLSLTAQVTRDLGEKWNVGVVVPYLYKYYRDYGQLPVDVSNAGIGDINLLLTRKLGPINATSLSASVGLPTGTYKAQYKMDYLSQEKQLGLGRITANLMLDHAMDETWGLIVLGGSVSYRGGENELRNYRSPAAGLWAYSGYFLGPFVPALGLSLNRFWKQDRNRSLEQKADLTSVAGNVSLEWSSDYVAILAGGSFPYSIPSFELQPWIVALGLTFSPF